MFGFIFVKLYVLHPRTERASFRPDGPNSPSERTPKTAGFRVRTVPTGGFSPFVYIYNIFRSHGAERTRSRLSRSASGIARSLKLTDRITHRKLLVWQHTTLQRAQIYNARNAEALVETPNWKISKARGESRNRSNPRGLVVSVEDFPSPAKTETSPAGEFADSTQSKREHIRQRERNYNNNRYEYASRSCKTK